MASPRQGTTVLVVEDDPSLREFYRATLSTERFKVIAVDDGFDALVWLDQHAPDAIVLDLSLIRVNGRDVHREVRGRAETRNIPIIVVTGEQATDLHENELVCVLQKPITPETLVEAVTHCLQRQPSSRASLAADQG